MKIIYTQNYKYKFQSYREIESTYELEVSGQIGCYNKKNRQGCMFALHMQHVLDGFFFYDILLVKPND